MNPNHVEADVRAAVDATQAAATRDPHKLSGTVCMVRFPSGNQHPLWVSWSPSIGWGWKLSVRNKYVVGPHEAASGDAVVDAVTAWSNAHPYA